MSRTESGTEGAIFIETLIAIMVPVYFFFITWQLTDLFTAQLILKHAAVAAARAAVVVGPDDPRFYDGQPANSFTGLRLDDVKSATALVLAASPHFVAGGFKLDLQGTFEQGGMLTAVVEASYPCFSPWLNVVCGGMSFRNLTARAVFPYQGAGYPFDGS